MVTTIPVYYLDEPLSEADSEFLIDSLRTREDLASEVRISQTRVATVLPAPLHGQHRDSTADIQLLKNHLIRAGLRSHAGRQIVWVMPRDTGWGVRFQLSIFEITGFYPYILQRWSVDEDGGSILGESRLIDGHGMMGGKG